MNGAIKQRLREIPLLKEIAVSSAETNEKLFLVGGLIRDTVSGAIKEGKEGIDFDLLVKGDTSVIGSLLGEKLKGSCFPIDKERDVSVVVSKDCSDSPFRIDIARLKGEGIENNLKERDFTINSIAVELSSIFSDGDITLIDPLYGIEDVIKKKIRANSPGVLDEDPLRLLRAVRFEETLDFTICVETENWIVERAKNIRYVSGERVRDEIFKLLSSKKGRGARFFQRMKELGLLEIILPEIGKMDEMRLEKPHKYLLWEHSIRTIHHAETFIKNFPNFFSDHYKKVEKMLSRQTEYGIRWMELFKLSAVLHDTGKPVTCKIGKKGEIDFPNHEIVGASINRSFCERLKMSKKSTKVVCLITNNHMKPIYMSRQKDVMKKDMFSFFRDTGELGVIVCLISVADAFAAKGVGYSDEVAIDIERLVRQMLNYYFEEYTKIGVPLLTGNDLIEKFNLTPGPFFKTILHKLEEARAEGIILNRKEAFEYLEKNLLVTE